MLRKTFIQLAAITVLLALLWPSAPGHAAQGSRGLRFQIRPAEAPGLGTAGVYNNGLFPGLIVAADLTWSVSNKTDVPYNFTVELSYPYPYVEYYPGQAIEKSQQITSCTHDATAHKFTCAGSLPPSNPTQSYDLRLTIYFLGRPELYEKAQTAGNTVVYTLKITYSDGWIDEGTADYPVEPIVNLTVTPEAPAPLHGATGVLIEENNLGVLLKWGQPYPWPDCATDPIDPRYDEILFQVAYRKKGAASWTTAGEATGANCTKQARLAVAALQCKANGDPETYEWRVQAVDVRYFTGASTPNAVKDNVFEFTTASCRPKIEKIQPDYTVVNSYFLANVSVPNKLRVEVDWNGDAYKTPDTVAPYGTMIFNLNAQLTQVEGQSWGAERTFNMGQDFQNSLTCNNNTLVIKAAYPNGAATYESAETTLQTTVFPNPTWVQWAATNLPGADSTFEAALAAPLVKYTYDFTYPKEAFTANWTPPSWMPYLGGKKLGILDTQGQFAAQGQSNGAGNFNANGQTGLGLAALDVKGEVFGSGNVEFVCGKSLNLTSAELGMKITGEIKKELGLADLVPGVRAAENWVLVGRLIRWINKIASVEAILTPNVMAKALFAAQNDKLEFTGVEGRAGLGAEAILGVQPIEDLGAQVYGGGEPYISLQAPANPSYLKELGIDLKFGAKLQAWSYEETYEVKYNCLSTGVCQAPPAENLQALAETPWHLIPRDYAGVDYAVFAPRPINTPRLTLAGLASAAATTETVLVSNVYPRAEPALAISGTTRLLAYVHDDLTQPQGRGTEIRLLASNGLGWQAPVTITHDQQPDYAPAVAPLGNGQGLLLWERSNLPGGITPTLSITFGQSLEIAGCYWNGSVCGALMTLTQNSLMDYAPRLATGADGAVLALWQTQAGTDLLGTAAQPLTLTYALWTGASWTAPAPALTGLQDVVNVALAARSASQAALAYVRDLDGDLSTITDTEVYSSTFNGSAWSAPARLTTDAVAEASPALAYDAAGNLHLLWLHDGNLVWMKNGGAPQTVRAASTAGGFLGFTLARAANGNLALLWQAMSASGANLTYSVYDAANDDWGAGQALTRDHDLELSAAAGFGTDGTLYLAYQKIATDYYTQTVPISATYTVTFTNVPRAGQSDLAFLTHTLGQDLLVDSLSLAPTAPLSGAPVALTAVLRNAGALTINNASVAFYAGSLPLSNSQTVAELKAGYTATVTINWIPAATGAVTLRAVADPAAQIAELDETNNEITLNVAVGAATLTERRVYLPSLQR